MSHLFFVADIVPILTALVPLTSALTPVMLAAFAILTIVFKTRSDVKLAEVARLAAQATAQNQKSTAKIMETTKDIHTLVNSQYGIALALILERSLRVYELSLDPKDKEEVDKARKNVVEHEARQHVVDHGPDFR